MTHVQTGYESFGDTESGQARGPSLAAQSLLPILVFRVVPFNPRTPAQVAVRGVFGGVSARWRTLREEERLIWCAVAKRKKSRVRLRQCGPLTGFLYFVKINVALAHRGVAQVDLPPEHCEAAQRRC